MFLGKLQSICHGHSFGLQDHHRRYFWLLARGLEMWPVPLPALAPIDRPFPGLEGPGCWAAQSSPAPRMQAAIETSPASSGGYVMLRRGGHTHQTCNSTSPLLPEACKHSICAIVSQPQAKFWDSHKITSYALLVSQQVQQKATWNIFPAVHGTSSRGCAAPHSFCILLHACKSHVVYASCRADVERCHTPVRHAPACCAPDCLCHHALPHCFLL